MNDALAAIQTLKDTRNPGATLSDCFTDRACPTAAVADASSAPQSLNTVALVLVVNDNLDLSVRLWAILHERGYRVCLAFNAAEAAEYVQGPAFQVVVIDMKLPNADVSSLSRQLRESNPRARTLLVTASATATEPLVQQILSDDSHGTFAKPSPVPRLLAGLQTLMN